MALAPSQRDAIALAICSKVLVITGGPGVGKTVCTRAIVSEARSANLRSMRRAGRGLGQP